ncbi:MazG-like family protein [Streptomyces sp. NPDC007205]|uniref:MazG-like family protein n=1 Tax=Streptomyces sp. NPDC007205 TaxID=3154316 RepID=UPI0033FEB786
MGQSGAEGGFARLGTEAPEGGLWQVVGSLADVCAGAGVHLPAEELKALQVGKVAEEAGEAMHALHGLKGLTTCDDRHDWAEVSNDLAGAVLASMIALRYVNVEKAPELFNEVMFRRTPRGRAALETPAV